MQTRLCSRAPIFGFLGTQYFIGAFSPAGLRNSEANKNPAVNPITAVSRSAETLLAPSDPVRTKVQSSTLLFLLLFICIHPLPHISLVHVSNSAVEQQTQNLTKRQIKLLHRENQSGGCLMCAVEHPCNEFSAI